MTRPKAQRQYANQLHATPAPPSRVSSQHVPAVFHGIVILTLLIVLLGCHMSLLSISCHISFFSFSYLIPMSFFVSYFESRSTSSASENKFFLSANIVGEKGSSAFHVLLNQFLNLTLDFLCSSRLSVSQAR